MGATEIGRKIESILTDGSENSNAIEDEHHHHHRNQREIMQKKAIASFFVPLRMKDEKVPFNADEREKRCNGVEKAPIDKPPNQTKNR